MISIGHEDEGDSRVIARTVVPVCAALLAACCSVAAQSLPARITPLPNGIELTSGASVLEVQIVENQVVRVHTELDGKMTARTLVMDPNPVLRQPSVVTRSERDAVYTLSTPTIRVRIKETKPYSITFLDAAGRQLLRSEDPFREARDAGVTMSRDRSDTLYGIRGLGREDTAAGLTRNEGGRVAAGVQGDSGAPFVFSVRWGLLVDSDGGEFITGPDGLTFARDSRPDVEYFVCIGPPLDTMAALSRLVGPPPLPPKWTLGFLNSQWGTSQAEVERIVDTYRERKLPIDGFILDFDWKAWGEDNYGEWRWNSSTGSGNVAPEKFSDGASGAFARRLAGEGVKLGGILKPRILTTVAGDPNQPTEAAAYATANHFWYPDEVLIPDYYSRRMGRNLDFNNAAARAWYWQHLLPAFRAGMVAWWNDEADVSGDTVFNNFQFLNMGRMLYDGQRADSDLRVWSINRNFYLGSSRYGYAGWSGDIKTGFESMAFQRRRMLAALDTGEFHWSMDTGGFSGDPSPENYARWVEFAAFVPIMRVHGDLNRKRQPWVYGPIAEAAARNAIDLRYALLPYIYSYERRNTEGDVGLVRPLFWEFPLDRQAASQEAEWMFGDALLVAPIVAEGATSQSIYLPAGEWFDYATGRRYAGPQSTSIPADAKTWQDIPLFVRGGSIMATQPIEQHIGQQPVTEITLDIFPSSTVASFLAYDDDGETYKYEKDDDRRQEITSVRSGNEVAVTIGGATGSYAGPLRINYLLRIHTSANEVKVDGKPLPEVGASAMAAGASESWAADSDRFGPVVLLRVSAGAKEHSVITLRQKRTEKAGSGAVETGRGQHTHVSEIRCPGLRGFSCSAAPMADAEVCDIYT
jgi:alpha-glucosidase